MGRHLGLIIGVNTYQDATFRPLQCAESDARALAQWLVHARGGKWSAADVQLVLGAQASRELVESLLTQLCLRMAGPDDVVLIYFAGHAFIDQVSGEGYLAGYNTRYQQSGSGIHVPALVSQIMARCPAAQVLCILDCCQFGSVWQMRRNSPSDFTPLLTPTLQSELQQMQGRLLYTTCRSTDALPEVCEKNLGSFMYRAIMGMNGPALEATSGQVTLQRLHTLLCEQLGEQHRPQVFGQEPRPLVLVGPLPSFPPAVPPRAYLDSMQSPDSPNGARPGGASVSFGPNGVSPVQTQQYMSGSVAQLSPANTPPGQAILDTLAQNRVQQSQQMLNQARQLVQMQDFSQAYGITEAVLQMDPTFADALILKAQILGASGQFQEALATIEQVVEYAPDNALGWSMLAALLANTGQLSEGMTAADRSLSLDPSNSETIAIKSMIREKLAQRDASTGKRSRLLPSEPQQPRSLNTSFALGVGIQLGALILGLVGVFLPLLAPTVPPILSFLLESVALALLLVNAWRGAFLYGVKRFLITLVFSILTFILLVSLASGFVSARYAVKPLFDPLINHISHSFALMTPLFAMILWLAAATMLPLLVGLVGLIAGAVVRARGANPDI